MKAFNFSSVGLLLLQPDRNEPVVDGNMKHKQQSRSSVDDVIERSRSTNPHCDEGSCRGRRAVRLACRCLTPQRDFITLMSLNTKQISPPDQSDASGSTITAIRMMWSSLHIKLQRWCRTSPKNNRRPPLRSDPGEWTPVFMEISHGGRAHHPATAKERSPTTPYLLTTSSATSHLTRKYEFSPIHQQPTPIYQPCQIGWRSSTGTSSAMPNLARLGFPSPMELEIPWRRWPRGNTLGSVKRL